MAEIFDEAIVIVKCDSQLMDNQELKVMKALKLGKLYKELAKCRGELLEIDVDIPNIHRESEKRRYATLRGFIRELLKEIEELEK